MLACVFFTSPSVIKALLVLVLLDLDLDHDGRQTTTLMLVFYTAA